MLRAIQEWALFCFGTCALLVIVYGFFCVISDYVRWLKESSRRADKDCEPAALLPPRARRNLINILPKQFFGERVIYTTDRNMVVRVGHQYWVLDRNYDVIEKGGPFEAQHEATRRADEEVADEKVCRQS